jgi:hypothetical protein
MESFAPRVPVRSRRCPRLNVALERGLRIANVHSPLPIECPCLNVPSGQIEPDQFLGIAIQLWVVMPRVIGVIALKVLQAQMVGVHRVAQEATQPTARIEDGLAIATVTANHVPVVRSNRNAGIAKNCVIPMPIEDPLPARNAPLPDDCFAGFGPSSFWLFWPEVLRSLP